MNSRQLLGGVLALLLVGGFVRAQDDKVHEVGAGLKLTGELGKVSAITYKVKLEAGKTYVIDMISPDQKALDPIWSGPNPGNPRSKLGQR